MPEVSGKEFIKAATNYEPPSKEVTIEDAQGRQLKLELESLNRKVLFDHLHNLPSGFLGVILGGDVDDLEDVESPEDVDLDIDMADVLKNIDGDAIGVFEDVFAESASHPELTSIDLETLAQSESISIQLLFDLFGEVVDLSLQNPNEIKRFRGAE